MARDRAGDDERLLGAGGQSDRLIHYGAGTAHRLHLHMAGAGGHGDVSAVAAIRNVAGHGFSVHQQVHQRRIGRSLKYPQACSTAGAAATAATTS